MSTSQQGSLAVALGRPQCFLSSVVRQSSSTGVLAAAVPCPIPSRAGDLGEETGLRSRQAVGLSGLTHSRLLTAPYRADAEVSALLQGKQESGRA